MTDRSQDWCILRCSGANTLRLAQSLAWADIEAWSPAVREVERAGESRTRRPRRIPVAPGYVFARYEHLHELLAIKEAPHSPHPDFSFLRHVGEIRPIANATLNFLRMAEEKGKAPEEARKWKRGDRVRYPAMGFEGLVGIVERTKGKAVWVSFPKHNWPVEAPAFLLFPEHDEAQRQAA